MKKIILSFVYLVSLPCFITSQPPKTIAQQLAKKRVLEERSKRESVQELSEGVAESLIEHSPELIKKFVRYLHHSASNGEVKPKTLFLYGPSGVGKTETAIALAMKAHIPYTVIEASSVGDKYQNSAKNQLEKLLLPIIRSGQRHVIIIDEITRLIENYNEEKGSREDNNTATRSWDLLNQCIKTKNILIIATANNIDRCPQMVRTRFGTNVAKLEMPDVQAQKRILQLYMPKKFTCSETVLEQLAKAVRGIPPRVLKNIIESAELNLSCENRGRIHFEFKDFNDAIERYKVHFKEKGVLSIMVKNAKNNAMDHPVGTTFSIAAGLGGIAAIAYNVSKFLSRSRKAAVKVVKCSPETLAQIIRNCPAATQNAVQRIGPPMARVLQFF